MEIPYGQRKPPMAFLSSVFDQAKGFLNLDGGKTRRLPSLDAPQPFQVGSSRFIAVPTAKELRSIDGDTSIFRTVFDLGGRSTVTRDWISEQLSAFKSCDTFQPEFLQSIIFVRAAAEPVTFEEPAEQALQESGVEWTEVIPFYEDQSSLQPGPYLLSDGKAFELWSLYDDTQGCFVRFCSPGDGSGVLENFQFTGQNVQTLSTAVPSRLRYDGSQANTLEGIRFAVEDSFNIAGIKTTLGSRAYCDLYPAPARTAACIQKLVDAGAALVGKTKLGSFGTLEEPINSIDFQAPWNPRGDGYQSPAGGSSGSAAAIASYDWLDIALGSDTTGGSRRSAHWNGCFAMRPSHGLLPMDGFVPRSRQFDAPTFFGRDLHKCKAFAEAWYGEALATPPAELPISVVTTDYPSIIANQDQLLLIERFVADLEDCLKTERQTISLESLWTESPPETKEAWDAKLSNFIEGTCLDAFRYDQFHSMEHFRHDYEKKFGKKPYVSPPVRRQWDFASRITQDQRNEAVEKLETLRAWFSERVMKLGIINTILVLPIENISERYRDEAIREGPALMSGTQMLFLSPILGGPELTIPIGQVPYQSKVTDREEHLPVGISLLASPGFDINLMDLALKCLNHANRPTAVQPGKEIFHSE